MTTIDSRPTEAGTTPAPGPPAPAAGRRQLERVAPLLAPALYVISGLILLPFFRFIDNKDEVAYISVAMHYADGDVLHGVNSYWAPMLSWLLAPLLAAGAAPTAAAKLLGLGIGLFALLCARRLTFTVGMRPLVRNVVMVLLVPVVLSYALLDFTPDLLHAGILLLYLSAVTSRTFPAGRWAGAVAGLLGALLFFSKAYGLPFFLAHFVAAIAVHLFLAADRPARRALLLHGLSGLAVFAVLAGAWGGLLAQKYGSFSLGVGGSYNISIAGPGSPGIPTLTGGLVAPPAPAFTSVWEEPHYFTANQEPWSPLASSGAAEHQLRRMARNARLTAETFQQFTMLSVVILTAAVVLCMLPRKRLASQKTLLLWLLTMAIYAGGYVLIYSAERYLWGLLILTLVLGGHLLSMLFDTPMFNTPMFEHRGRVAVVLAVFASTALIHPVAALGGGRNKGRDVNAIIDQLRGAGLGGTDIASSDDFGASNVLAFRLGARYWGHPPEGSPEADAVERLDRTPVRYYLIWNDAPQPTSSAFTKLDEVRRGKKRLTVYAVS